MALLQKSPSIENWINSPTLGGAVMLSGDILLCLEILGLPPEFTNEELKKAYRRRALETHPDLQGDPELFKRVHDAWELLKGYLAYPNPWKLCPYHGTISKKNLSVMVIKY